MHRAIQGCIRCGSDDLRLPGIRDGVIVGLGQDFGTWSCNRCGFTGAALRFDDEAARAAYEKERAQTDAEPVPAVGWPHLRMPGQADDVESKHT